MRKRVTAVKKTFRRGRNTTTVIYKVKSNKKRRRSRRDTGILGLNTGLGI